MSSVERPSISNSLKQQVIEKLSPYFTGNYSNEVKNPVLLLNFLYQHSIIPKPEYEILPDPNKRFHFIGSCTVGTHKSEVAAGSKKDCKNKAAQKILDLFLDEQLDITYVDHEYAKNTGCDAQTYQITQSICTMNINRNKDEFCGLSDGNYLDRIETPAHTGNFYDDDLSGILLFDKAYSDHRIEFKSETNKLHAASSMVNQEEMQEAQCEKMKSALHPSKSSLADSSSIVIAQPQCSLDLCTDINMKTLVSTSRNNSTTIQQEGVEIVERQCDMPETKSNFLNSSQIATLEKSNEISVNQNQAYGDRVLFNDNLYVDFFDPFLRLRPKTNVLINASQKENSGKENTNETILNCEAQTKFSTELTQNNKTPFQILQEKAVKNFKLIPRSRIEKTDNGFSCTLILDVHTGYGEGRTKKESKLKAATHLLQLLGNI